MLKIYISQRVVLSQNKMELINTAKAIASNAKFILKFANVIAEQCVDER